MVRKLRGVIKPMMILHIFMAFILILSAFFAGVIHNKKTIIGSYLYGQIFMWAVFQTIAVPLVLLKAPFILLVIVYSLVLIVFLFLGLKSIPALIKSFDLSRINVPLILALILIVGQMLVYFLGMHLDEDDARWIAEANDAITKNAMYLHNPATGAYTGEFVGEVMKDVFSPWSMYIAFFAKVTGINAAIVAHTILAPLLLAISYMVYHEISKILFKGKTEVGLFLLSVAVINLFFGGNRHTQSVTSLIRIWQGKAIVAAIMIPMVFMLFLNMKEATHKHESSDEEETQIKKGCANRSNWLWIMVAGCSGCLFSGMGIAISALMIGVLGAYTIVCKKWKEIPYFLLAIAPSIIFGFGYFLMR